MIFVGKCQVQLICALQPISELNFLSLVLINVYDTKESRQRKQEYRATQRNLDFFSSVQTKSSSIRGGRLQS